MLRFFLLNFFAKFNQCHQEGSDLGFAIDKAFREKNFPFLQHDIYIEPLDDDSAE